MGIEFKFDIKTKYYILILSNKQATYIQRFFFFSFALILKIAKWFLLAFIYLLTSMVSNQIYNFFFSQYITC